MITDHYISLSDLNYTLTLTRKHPKKTSEKTLLGTDFGVRFYVKLRPQTHSSILKMKNSELAEGQELINNLLSNQNQVAIH